MEGIMHSHLLQRICVMSQVLLFGCEALVLGEPRAEAVATECIALVSGLPSVACVPSNPIDLESFDPELHAKVSVNIGAAQGVTSCSQLLVDTSLSGESGAVDGEQATLQSSDDPNECLLRQDPSDGVEFFAVEPIDPSVCGAGAQFFLIDVALPEGAVVCVDYLVALE
jgi:hypothetical protein